MSEAPHEFLMSEVPLLNLLFLMSEVPDEFLMSEEPLCPSGFSRLRRPGDEPFQDSSPFGVLVGCQSRASGPLSPRGSILVVVFVNLINVSTS